MDHDPSNIEIRKDGGNVTLHTPIHSTAEQSPPNRTVTLTLTELPPQDIYRFVFPSEMTLIIVGKDMFCIVHT